MFLNIDKLQNNQILVIIIFKELNIHNGKPSTWERL